MSHTKEPWAYARIEGSNSASSWHEPYSPWINGAGPRLVSVGRSIMIHADDYRRIVACVNACAGIPVETLEAVATDRQFWPIDLDGSSRKGLITLLGIQNFTVQDLKKQSDSETRKKLKKQRDELLAALNFARQGYQVVFENGEPD